MCFMEKEQDSCSEIPEGISLENAEVKCQQTADGRWLENVEGRWLDHADGGTLNPAQRGG